VIIVFFSIHAAHFPAAAAGTVEPKEALSIFKIYKLCICKLR